MKKIVSVFVIEIIMLIAMYGVLLLLKIVGLESGYTSKIIPFAIICIGTLLCLKLIDKKPVKQLGLIITKSTVLYSIMFIILAIIPLLYELMRTGNITAKSEFKIVDVIYYFIVGFSEELFFRGYTKVRMSEIRPGIWVIISAIAFSGLHLISSEVTPIALVFVFIMGISFAISYQCIGSIIPLLFFHVIWDICANYSDYSDAIVGLVISVLMVLISLSINKLIDRKKSKPIVL